jgi:hypothetical protein
MMVAMSMDDQNQSKQANRLYIDNSTPRATPVAGKVAMKRVGAFCAGMVVLLMGGCERYRTEQACAQAQDRAARVRWIVDESGIARDRASGLTWYRCNAGERYVAGACVGQASVFTHEQALQYAADFAAASGRGWRLPTRDELASLRVPACENPAVDSRVFPSVVVGHYWAGELGSRGFGLGCSLYTYSGWVQCRDDPLALRHAWLVVDR